ncbi:hypothetical protein D477_002683 [Arthrobacter crystallopoietes BAB-32]|uniref:Uncharacterized protein n=1 Tax=Arthrobacter crystallopoietes BAB-32 TaxID=1246476 RepID=N1VBV7_9MICC|nr:hypothetical protein [Arthrobacter crystallopoietes]EMY35763.1 hypothetical protein D477_002683 [Arthrobacter crystallopoietes BAB-32]
MQRAFAPGAQVQRALGLFANLQEVLGEVLQADEPQAPVFDETRRWLENKQARNVLALASKKTDTKTGGSVSSRVAAAVLNDEQYSDDELVVEHLSGALRSKTRRPAG